MPGIESIRWIRQAREDLAYANLGKETFARGAAWNAQQAAEKALKAVLLAHGSTAPRTHDLGFLLTEIARTISDADSLSDAALSLAEISPATRYPGDWPEFSSEEVQRFLEAAERIVVWAEAKLA
jgi:HEPN domain-containing protein